MPVRLRCAEEKRGVQAFVIWKSKPDIVEELTMRRDNGLPAGAVRRLLPGESDKDPFEPSPGRHPMSRSWNRRLPPCWSHLTKDRAGCSFLGVLMGGRAIHAHAPAEHPNPAAA
jgi:hypothetical protein